jgi:hypothetical protein
MEDTTVRLIRARAMLDPRDLRDTEVHMSAATAALVAVARIARPADDAARAAAALATAPLGAKAYSPFA